MDPTIIFVAQHSTGHRYVGKTRRLGLFEKGKYTGSGLEWLRHKEQYGEYASIIAQSEAFTDEEEIREFAEFLSEELDIVASDLYLNKKIETGLDGGSSSDVYGPSSRKQMSESARARCGEHTTQHLLTPEVAKKQSLAAIERCRRDGPPPNAGKNGGWNKGMKTGPQKRIECSKCGDPIPNTWIKRHEEKCNG